jgi:hypothetical protein
VAPDGAIRSSRALLLAESRSLEPLSEIPSPAEEARLNRRYRRAEHESDLAEIVAEQVVQEENLHAPGLQLDELQSQPFRATLRLDSSRRVGRTRPYEVVIELMTPINDLALATPRPQRIQADVGGDARSPRSEIAEPREGVARQGQNNLLERLLNEIVVIRPALPQHAVKRSIHRVEQAGENF